MKESKFIPAWNHTANENVETGRKGKFWEDQDALKESYDDKKRALELRSAETMKLKQELNGDTLESKSVEKSFPSLFKAFSSDILIIRKMVVQYNELKDEHLREIKGEEILAESEKIALEISHQVNAASDAHEKADLDNLRIELGQVTRNITGFPESKVVNE